MIRTDIFVTYHQVTLKTINGNCIENETKLFKDSIFFNFRENCGLRNNEVELYLFIHSFIERRFAKLFVKFDGNVEE